MFEYKAKILRWIDGDTLLVEVDLGFYVKKEEKVRLARTNAPEPPLLRSCVRLPPFWKIGIVDGGWLYLPDVTFFPPQNRYPYQTPGFSKCAANQISGIASSHAG